MTIKGQRKIAQVFRNDKTTLTDSQSMAWQASRLHISAMTRLVFEKHACF
jgi:hypothetical protein